MAAVRARENAARVGDPTVRTTGMVVRRWVKGKDASQRELTRDEIVETVLCPEWELTDEGEPGQ